MDKRRNRTLDILYAWAAIGPVFRLLLATIIVVGAVWTAKYIVELVAWLVLLLG